jgi:hypothetical protein
MPTLMTLLRLSRRTRRIFSHAFLLFVGLIFVSAAIINQGSLLSSAAVSAPFTNLSRALASPGVSSSVLDSLPDLQITDLWIEESSVCYQIYNSGDMTAPAGHATALWVDGELVALQDIEQTLEPEQRLESCFAYLWSCTLRSDTLAVAADYWQTILESNEENNLREESVKCDTIPPQILEGPVVSEITSQSALILWMTDEPSTSGVHYGHYADRNSGEVIQEDLVTSHSVALDGLLPNTTYQFVVFSKDSSDNEVTSRSMSFATLPAISRTPQVRLADPGTISGTVTIIATTTDVARGDRVLFFLNSELVLTDYSPPYSLELDSLQLENGSYLLEAKAINSLDEFSVHSLPVAVFNEKDASSPTVTITSPANNQTVAGKVNVNATLQDDTGIVSARFYVDGDYQQFEGYDVDQPPKSTSVTFVWDSRSYPNGSSHRLAVQAFDTEGKQTVAYVDVTVNNILPPEPPGPPLLEVVNHYVLRNNNRLIVFLQVRNSGGTEAVNVRILDGLVGFQAITNTSGATAYWSEYIPAGRYGYADIRPKVGIPPGESRLYAFNAIPVLHDGTPPKPSIGSFIDMYWDSAVATNLHRYQPMPVANLTLPNESIGAAHAAALKASDYLLVTNPGRLVASYVPAFYQGPSLERTSYNRLLSGMAELAYHKKGALGYMSAYSPQALRDLLISGGSWSSQMAPGWATNGYLLLVGENNIIPAWSRYIGTQYTTRGDYDFIAKTTDYPYASTSGSELRPELSIGRIVGGSPELLRIPIVTSIQLWTGAAGYHYDGLQFFGASGFPACLGGGCDNINFKTELDHAIKYMPGGVVAMNTPVYTVYNSDGSINKTATINAIKADFVNHIRYKDVIFLAGHGNAGGWDVIAGTDISSILNPFITYNPLVYASSCLTGQYSAGFSMAEAYLKSKASAYFGATEVGACPGDGFCPNADKFFANFNSSKPLGLAVKDTKNSLGDNFFDNWWNAIYHLFGDPKISAATAASAQVEVASQPAILLELSENGLIDIHVPGYEITRTLAQDFVTITGGLLPVTPGRPLVPAYQVAIPLPANVQIQQVELVSQSRAEQIPGLVLPPATLAFLGDSFSAQVEDTRSPEWWPDRAYEWFVESGPEFNTLFIQANPFYYNHLTLQGLFISDFTFQVTRLDSPITITQLSTDRHIYDPAAPVEVKISLHNFAGLPQNGIVSAYIRRAGTRQVISGLLLETLYGLQGQAQYESVWDSAGAAPGEYTVVVELRDERGDLLASHEQSFTIGRYSGEVTQLWANPVQVQPGKPVHLAMSLLNTGSLPIEGSLVLQVFGPDGMQVADFHKELPGLDAGQTAWFEDIWETAGLPSGAYTLVGYGQYQGQTSLPAASSVTIQHQIYLPLASR